MLKVCIHYLSDNETVVFAAEELKKYLMLLCADVDAALTSEETECDNCIILSLWDKEISESDTTTVDVDGLSGKISGSNPRSVLFGVYQYLEALGVRWVRHGADGEYIPDNHDFSKDSVHFERTAKYSHRAMMNEGALSFENALDNVDWCAKVGFNEYYIQFILPKAFYKHWYEHQYNPTLEKTFLTDDDYAEFNKRLIREIKKRGMLLYVVGHGWHNMPFGFPAQYTPEISEQQRSILAKISGEREYFNKRSISSTHLCYSQKKVRKGIVDFVIEYLRNNPEADYLMFPLADGCNNHCECEECSKYIPSDLYVKLMNEIDAALEANGFKQKVVIAIYCDYLWCPEKEKLNNPDRFLYCFAPFHKTNKKSYKDMDISSFKIAPYQRNKLKMPETVEELILHLKSWQNHQMVSGFDHEYYFYVGEHYFDFGSVFLANIILEDIRSLKDLGLDGIMSCQSQRSFMPTGLGSYVMIKALWDDSFDFDEFKNEYFKASFGSEAEVFGRYLTYLSKIVHEGDAVPYDKVIFAAKEMYKYINGLDLEAMNKCFAASVKYIAFHCRLIILYCKAEKIMVNEGFEKSRDA